MISSEQTALSISVVNNVLSATVTSTNGQSRVYQFRGNNLIEQVQSAYALQAALQSGTLVNDVSNIFQLGSLKPQNVASDIQNVAFFTDGQKTVSIQDGRELIGQAARQAVANSPAGRRRTAVSEEPTGLSQREPGELPPNVENAGSEDSGSAEDSLEGEIDNPGQLPTNPYNNPDGNPPVDGNPPDKGSDQANDNLFGNDDRH